MGINENFYFFIATLWIFLYTYITTTSKEVKALNEKQLVMLAKSGDKDAFCSLYGKYKEKLFRYAYYHLKNVSDAEDAVSECVVLAFSEISKLKKAESFSSWIFRIMYCTCTKYIKKQVNQRQSIEISTIANTYTVEQNKAENKTEVMQALNILSDDEREIVMLSIIGGLKSKEIAEIKNLTAGSVRSKLSRSLAKMRKFLE